MTTTIRRVVLSWLFGCSLVIAQPGFQPGQPAYVAFKQTALTGAAEVITVQQPSSGSKNVSFVAAYVDCTVTCTITLERNGAAATTTTLAVAQVNPDFNLPATATAFSSSNVGVGTVLGKFTIQAGGSLIWDLTDVKQAGANTGVNFTIRTSSITGTVNIQIKWREL